MTRFLLCLLLMCSSVAMAQKVPRNAKSIIITIDTTAGKKETINAVAAYLLSKNYEIDLVNYDLGLVQTKDATLRYVHWRHRISASLSGDKLRFSGKAIVKDVAMDIENKGSLGSLQVHAFRKLEELASQYPHTSIEYK